MIFHIDGIVVAKVTKTENGILLKSTKGEQLMESREAAFAEVIRQFPKAIIKD